VFDSFEHCECLYDDLPDTFTAADVGQSGLTGGRRHMLVWHYVEHPAFACSLTSRQPLTVEKATDDDAAASRDESTTTDTPGVMPADD
jgi:hypothetical protein